MVALNLPPFEHKVLNKEGKATIFDTIRKKYVALTPEEWVRQHFIHYLTDHLHYARSLIGVENGLAFNRMQRRSDIIVYNRQGIAHMVVECKSYQQKLSPKVFEQIARYNDTLKAPYVVVTNGLDHYCCQINHAEKTYHFMDCVPACEQET